MVFEDYYARVRIAVHEYKLDIDSNAYRNFAEFRHRSKSDQDKILVWFRKDFPKLYSILMEVQMFHEQYKEHPLLNEQPMLESEK